VVNTGAGNDQIVVGSASATLNTFAGPLGLDAGPGANSLVVNDSGDAFTNVLNVAAGVIYSTVEPFVLYEAASGGDFSGGVALFAGAGDDQVYVTAQPANAPLFVSGGGGNDLLAITMTASSGYSNVTFDGGAGFNVLLYQAVGAAVQSFPNDATSGTIFATFPGGLTSAFNYENIDSLSRTG
jgi:hypothetical protein